MSTPVVSYFDFFISSKWSIVVVRREAGKGSCGRVIRSLFVLPIGCGGGGMYINFNTQDSFSSHSVL